MSPHHSCATVISNCTKSNKTPLKTVKWYCSFNSKVFCDVLFFTFFYLYLITKLTSGNIHTILFFLYNYQCKNKPYGKFPTLNHIKCMDIYIK